MAGATERGLSLFEPGEFEALVGRGISAVVNGSRLLAGNRRLMADNEVDVECLHARASAMEHQRKVEALRSNARPTTRTVVPHELIPGHHLQGFHVERRPERAAWHSPFFVEGWAVHGEWLMDRHGFFRDPRERIGHLFWRLLRAARIVVSTRFHLREWTPAQMVDFMVEQAGLERSAAQAEVDRYMTYSPLYQCAYLYGAWQIRQLREECRARWDAAAGIGSGPVYDDVRFHRRLVEQGSIPIAFARMALLDEREVRPWK